MSMSKEEVIKKVHELIAAPSCCAEAKEAGNNFIKALGTPNEKDAAKALINELSDDVTSVDGLGLSRLPSPITAKHSSAKRKLKILRTQRTKPKMQAASTAYAQLVQPAAQYSTIKPRFYN